MSSTPPTDLACAAGKLDAVVDAMDERGRCSPLIVATDVLYARGDATPDALEGCLRRLVALGGCRTILFCWRTRNFREEGFLPRLADLGAVEVRAPTSEPTLSPCPRGCWASLPRCFLCLRWACSPAALLQ